VTPAPGPGVLGLAYPFAAARAGHSPRSFLRGLAANAPFLVVAALLIGTFLLGGSARAGVQSLMVLRPLAALALGYGLWTLRPEHLRRHRVLLALALAVVALPLLHLMPLPHAVWSALPGREQIVAIDRLAGLGQIARPLSLVPDATANALLSLLVPMAVLVLGIQLDRPSRKRLVPLIILLALASATLGVMQLLGPRGGPLYLYDITNADSAVGLFANRNHQACLLAMAIPLIALWGTRRGRGPAQRSGPGTILRRVCALTAIGMLVPLILVTGSRAGLLLAAIAILAVAGLLPGWLAQAQEARARRRGRTTLSRLALPLGLVSLAGLLAMATAFTGRAEAWNRLRLYDPEDLRFRAFPAAARAAWRYWPAGSGIGSFEAAYQSNEPDALLAPGLLNHAHDDWLELVMTGGLPAVILLVTALAVAIGAIFRVFRPTIPGRAADPHGQVGAILLGLVAVASIGDYPLRTPAIEAIFVIAAIMVTCAVTPQAAIAATGGESAPRSY